MDIQDIAKKIKENGGRLYLVGGALRDRFLEKEIYDEDYCVTGLESSKFQEIFPDAKSRGKSFEVFELNGKEFAMARREIKTGKGHKEFSVESNKDIDILEDLIRRDITINAIAEDVLTKEIIDPFNGIKDIKEKKLRAVSDKFKEDPLRVYRVARFSASLQFEIDKDTLKLMENLKDELKYLSKERIFVEFKKALSSDEPSMFFEALKQSNTLDIHFKEIKDLIGAIQPENYHPEGDSYNHTMRALDISTKYTKKVEERFSVLVHDLGKGTTKKELYPHHYGHDERGAQLVENLGNRIGVPNSWIECGKIAAKEHMKAGIFNSMTIQKQVRFIEKTDKTKLGLEGLKTVVICDKLSSNGNIDDIQFDKIGKKLLNNIDGNYVINKYGNISRDKKFGEILHKERVEYMKNI